MSQPSTTIHNEATQILDLDLLGDVPPVPRNGAGPSVTTPSAHQVAHQPAHQAPQRQAPPEIVTHDVHVVSSPAKKIDRGVSRSTWMPLLLILAAVGGLGYGLYYFGLVDQLLVLGGFADPSFPVVPPHKIAKIPDQSPPSTKPEDDDSLSPNAPANIWSAMENQLGGELIKDIHQLTLDQESTFREGLANDFRYQHYKAVIDMGKVHAYGTEELLRTALGDKGFWVRMRAAIGLVDLGKDLSTEDIKLALGSAHSELRARFFKRFESSPCSVGCYFVARAAMPHLDARGRAEVLQVIAKEDSDVRDRYMIAATFDDSPTIRAFATDWLTSHRVDDDVYEDVKDTIGR